MCRVVHIHCIQHLYHYHFTIIKNKQTNKQREPELISHFQFQLQQFSSTAMYFHRTQSQALLTTKGIAVNHTKLVWHPETCCIYSQLFLWTKTVCKFLIMPYRNRWNIGDFLDASNIQRIFWEIFLLSIHGDFSWAFIESFGGSSN